MGTWVKMFYIFMGHFRGDSGYSAIGPMASMHVVRSRMILKNDLQHWPSASAQTKPKINLHQQSYFWKRWKLSS